MLARLYLQNSNKAINEEITFHLQKGRENRRAGKLKQAKIHYESILRLLHYEKSQKEYDEAQNQLNEINLILGERE